MESRICCRCDVDQPLCEYGVQKNGPNGLRSQCRSCRRIEAKEYRERNLDKVKEAKKKWVINNPTYDKEYAQLNPDKKRKASLKWLENNRELANERTKKWAKNNPDKVNEIQRNYNNKNPHIVAWRNTLKNSLVRMGRSKNGHTIEFLGYSAIELKDHITSLFTDGMSWNNYGEWHIDHIIGIANFDPETPQSIVNALSNLRPLWATTREINGIVYEGNLNRPK
jgi:hypothetical protein